MRKYRFQGMKIMKTKLFVLLIIIGFCAPCYATKVEFHTKKVHGVTARVIDVPLGSGAARMDVVVAQGFPGTSESPSSMIRRSRPVAAVSGTFFCKKSLIPVGDIVKNGKYIHFGGLGTALAITKDNQVAFVDVPKWRHNDWTGYETVLAAGPRLLRDGAVDVRPKEQGFSDPHVLGSASRVAAGYTRDGHLLLIMVKSSITLNKLAAIMKDLGCWNAINLDGGCSLFMYYRGKYLATPGRKLTNLFVVYEHEPGGVPTVPAPAVNAAPPPDDADAQYEYGLKMQKQGNFDQAVAALQRAATLNPTAAIFKALAQCFLEAGRNADAGGAYKMAGDVYFQKNMLDDAIIHYSMAVELQPDNSAYYEALARAQEEKGEQQQAEENLAVAGNIAIQNAMDMDPTPDPLPDVIPDNISLDDIPDATNLDWSDTTSFVYSTPEETSIASESDQHSGAGQGPDSSSNSSAPPTIVEPPELYGTVIGNTYREERLGFALDIPDTWIIQARGKYQRIFITAKDKPYFGSLQIFGLFPGETLEEFEKRFIAGTYKFELARDDKVKVAGRNALEVLYEEMLHNHSVGSRYLFVKQNNYVFVFSITTYAVHFGVANQQFSQIVESFTFLN